VRMRAQSLTPSRQRDRKFSWIFSICTSVYKYISVCTLFCLYIHLTSLVFRQRVHPCCQAQLQLKTRVGLELPRRRPADWHMVLFTEMRS
jgi:hypothetical protein